MEVTEEEFDEFLDEIFPMHGMGSMSFLSSDILKSCDPIAYRIAKAEYESSLEEE